MAEIESMCKRLRSLGYIITPPPVEVEDMRIGQRLKAIRAAHGYSLQEVADRIGASKAYVWEVEKGRAKNIGSDKIMGFCKLYNATPNFILLGKESL
tara:strand:+ start:495 stop:785 length:291 start_codon:yes stop_codon:yes gene_type:complete